MNVAQRAALATELGDRVRALGNADAYLAAQSRSFRFATRFFPARDAERVARVYAFCRFTDDLVDCPLEGHQVHELLDTWFELSRAAHAGLPAGIPLLERVMGEMASADVPFVYVAELVEGMRMDLRGERYISLPELRRYTYRVASVVGLWITRLFGVHDPSVLEQAERMGHAMQLTNIVRDVGEDWSRGRLYLPAELMARHGVNEAALASMCRGAPLVAGYRALVEELMTMAEAEYRSALAALPALPAPLARSVAVAAHLYRGIHREVRHHGYDNLRRRAYTTALRKGVHATRALWELRRACRMATGA